MNDTAKALRATAEILTARDGVDRTKGKKKHEAFLAKLKSDIRKLTKLYKSIPNLGFETFEDSDEFREALEKYNEVEDVFQRYKSYVWNHVESVIGDKDGYEKSLHTAKARFGSAISEMFGPRPKVGLWDKGRNEATNIRRFQDAGRKLQREYSYYTSHERSHVRDIEQERVNVGGLQFIVIRDENSTSDTEAKTGRVIRDILQEKKAIDRAGFSLAYRDLETEIYANMAAGRNLFVAGDYSSSDDRLRLHILSSFGVWTHEVGHRFYFNNLSANAIKVWREAINSKTVEVTRTAVYLWEKHKEKGYNKRGDRKLKPAALNRVLDGIVKLEKLDPSMEAQVRHVAHNGPLFLKDEVDDHAIGDKVLFEYVSDYGATNPEEAFAEAFRLYVLKGESRLQPWTRWFFREISRNGGAKIKSSSLAEDLPAVINSNDTASLHLNVYDEDGNALGGLSQIDTIKGTYTKVRPLEGHKIECQLTGRTWEFPPKKEAKRATKPATMDVNQEREILSMANSEINKVIQSKTESREAADEVIVGLEDDIDAFLASLIKEGGEIHDKILKSKKKVEGMLKLKIKDKDLEEVVLRKVIDRWGRDKMAPLLAKMIAHGDFTR